MASKNTFGGSENLEAMREAKKYNAFLVDEVRYRMQGCEHLLDFGAGNGLFAESMLKQGHKVACLEPEPALMSMLEAAGFVVYETLESIAPGSLDGIYTLNVLEHIENDRAILSSLYDRIRPGGQLYIYVPAFQSLFSAMDKKVGHVRRYRKDELVEKCRKAGFEVTASGYVDSLGFLASLAYRLLGAGNGTLNGNTIRLYDRYVFPLSRVIDALTSRLFGKNVWVHASRPVTYPWAAASISTSDMPDEYR